MTTATQTTADTTTRTENRRLVLRAFAALTAGAAIDSSSLYAADAVFAGPGSGIWAAAGAADPHGIGASPCVEIERISAEDERVMTQATVRAPSGRMGRALFVHEVAGSRIQKVSSVLSWS